MNGEVRSVGGDREEIGASFILISLDMYVTHCNWPASARAWFYSALDHEREEEGNYNDESDLQFTAKVPTAMQHIHFKNWNNTP